MVVEDENDVVGYVLTALNIKIYNQKLAVSWIPEMQLKYPLQSLTNDLSQTEKVSYSNFQLNMFITDMHESNKNFHF